MTQPDGTWVHFLAIEPVQGAGGMHRDKHPLLNKVPFKVTKVAMGTAKVDITLPGGRNHKRAVVCNGRQK